MNAHPGDRSHPSGAVEASQSLLEALSDLDAIVLVVCTFRPIAPAICVILLRKSRMPVVVARHGELLHHGAAEIIQLTGASSSAKRLASSQ